MRLRIRKGFTLIELLIAMEIVAILATIATPRLQQLKTNAYVAGMRSDLRNLVTAEEVFFADSAKYTSTVSQLKYSVTGGGTAPIITTGAGYWTALDTHPNVPLTQCAIGMNTTNPLVGIAVNEGEPACK